MLNKVILVGRITRDLELRYTQNGTAVCRFSVALDRRFTNKQGERETDFINIVTWRNLAENCANYLKKGSLIAIEGRLQTGKYENQEGRTIYTCEVVADDVRFLESKAKLDQRLEKDTNDLNKKEISEDPFLDEGKKIDISEDDLPF